MPGLTIVRGDFLRLDLDLLPAGALPVVANLPYSSGTAILARLLETPERFPRIVVMLQREVAERLCSQPGSRTYGALTVLTAARAAVSFGFVVPPGAFRPPPQVESAVVRLTPRATPRVPPALDARFREVVKAAFSSRRKTLANALAGGLGLSLVAARAAAARAGVDPGRRAETLNIDEFVALTARLS